MFVITFLWTEKKAKSTVKLSRVDTLLVVHCLWWCPPHRHLTNVIWPRHQWVGVYSMNSFSNASGPHIYNVRFFYINLSIWMSYHKFKWHGCKSTFNFKEILYISEISTLPSEQVMWKSTCAAAKSARYASAYDKFYCTYQTDVSIWKSAFLRTVVFWLKEFLLSRLWLFLAVRLGIFSNELVS